MRIGARLRQQREARGLTRRQVAEILKLSEYTIRAMEEESRQRLPGGFYRRGFVRQYAQFLGLELSDEEWRDLERKWAALDAIPTPPQPPKPFPYRWVYAGTVVLGLIIAWALFAWLRAPRSEPGFPAVQEKPAAEPAKRSDEITSVARPLEAPPAAPLRVRIVARENCWLDIYADDVRIFLGTLRAGDVYTIEATRVVRLATVGNAGGIDVYVNGELHRLGAPGEVRRNVVFRAQKERAPER